jgi:hypothetical protein
VEGFERILQFGWGIREVPQNQKSRLLVPTFLASILFLEKTLTFDHF